ESSQSTIRWPISDGFEKKNGSAMLARDSISQMPTKSTKVRICSATMVLRRARCRVVATARSSPAARAAALSGTLLIGALHLFAQIRPDALIELVEMRVEADLDDVARPRQVDIVDALEPRRPDREHDDLVGERDRLLEIVGHEEHGLARLLPERQQLVLH